MSAPEPIGGAALLQRIGKFEILAEIGQGAMGTVYRARDPILDRPVALKTVAPGLLSKRDTMLRFHREARAAARLQHVNIVTIYELGEVEGTLYIAMELLEGQDLAEAMTSPNPPSLDQKIRIVAEICRGLDFAHKRGVIHRDVKPANIRVLTDGSIKIVDFGIARLEDASMTQTGLILGTPSYIAPEVLTGKRVDHRADMWATGVVLYELLVGKLPYEGSTVASLVYRIVHEPPPRIDPLALGISEGLVGVVEKAMAKDPSQRYLDMAEMAAAVQGATGVPVSAETPLFGAAREKAYLRDFEEARRLLAENDLERALEAARRARALEPSRSAIVALVDQIEGMLQEAPTLGLGAVGSTREAPSVPEASRVEDATSPKPAPSRQATRTGASMAATRASVPEPPRRPATAVLEELRLRGASVFREIAVFGEPPGTASACLSPVKDLLATSGADGALRIWDLRNRTRVATLRTEMHQRSGHDAVALALAFSADGSLLASGHVDGSVHLWHVESGREYPAKLRHESIVGAVAFSPRGDVLASGGMDSNLKIWDVGGALEGEARRMLHRQPSGVTALAFAGESEWLVTGHANRLVRILDAKTYRLLGTLRGPEAQVSILCPAPDGRRMAVVSHDRTIRIFDMESRSQEHVVPGQRKPATGLAFFADADHLATVSQDNAVQLWDLNTCQTLAALWGPTDECFAGLGLFGGGMHIAVALADGRIRIWGPAL